MRRSANAQLQVLADHAGIYFGSVAMDALPYVGTRKNAQGEITDWGRINRDKIANDLAQDAIATPITTVNSGIPTWLSTYYDPKVVEVLLTPNNIAKICGGETRRGMWTDRTYVVPMIESTGEVSSYGDFNMNGQARANAQFESRQFYLYQCFTEWGDLEVETMGLAKIDYASRLNIASAIVLNKFQNTTYALGVQNLACYGLLNDPALPAVLTPRTKALGGTAWRLGTANEILGDVQDMFAQLQLQTGSNLEMDTPMVLGLHSVTEAYLANVNSLATITAIELIKKVFPNLRVQQAPQYLSSGVYSCQLIVEELNGQKTVEPMYNEKMRAHRIILADSSIRQKKTQGTGGAVVYFPAGITGMAGV